MKFEYDHYYENDKCVAFILGDSLHIKDDRGKNLVINDTGCFQGDMDWEDILLHAQKKFYRGDRVTITF
jgi:hypothetical protein